MSMLFDYPGKGTKKTAARCSVAVKKLIDDRLKNTSIFIYKYRV